MWITSPQHRPFHLPCKSLNQLDTHTNTDTDTHTRMGISGPTRHISFCYGPLNAAYVCGIQWVVFSARPLASRIKSPDCRPPPPPPHVTVQPPSCAAGSGACLKGDDARDATSTRPLRWPPPFPPAAAAA